jgi:hypothetical protein
MSRKKSRKARKQRMNSSSRALALPAADTQSEEISSSGVASSIRARGTHPEPSDDADVEAVTPAPASDPGVEPEPHSLSQLALLSATESIAPVAVPIAPTIPPQDGVLSEEPALSESPSKSPSVRESAPVSVREGAPVSVCTELQTTERRASSPQEPTSEPRDNVTPPPPSDWLEFHDFFVTAERDVSPGIDHALSEEMDDRPVVTGAQLARRAELRRLVSRIVGGLGIACVLIFGKELLFPPPSIEEVAAQRPPQLPLTAARADVGPSSPLSGAEPSIENVPPPPPITPEPEAEPEAGEQAVSPEASQPQDEAPALGGAEAKTSSGSKDAANFRDASLSKGAANPRNAANPRDASQSKDASNAKKDKAHSKPARLETKKSLREDTRQPKASAPAIAKAAPARAVKATARPSTAPRPALPERRAARSAPARPHQDPPAPAATHPTLPTSAGFPVAP